MRRSASSSVGFTPACARAKIAAAGSRRSSSIAIRASSVARQAVGARLHELAYERPVLVQRGPARRGVLFEGERQLGLLAAEQVEAAEAEAPQRTLKGLGADRHEFPLRGRAPSPLYVRCGTRRQALRVASVRLTDLGIRQAVEGGPGIPVAVRRSARPWRCGFWPTSRGARTDTASTASPRGGIRLAANHLASLDHPLIGIFSPRAIHYMAKEELLDDAHHRRAAHLDGRLSGASAE